MKNKRIDFLFNKRSLFLRIVLLPVFAIVLSCSTAQNNDDVIRLNQVGFYPDQEKLATVRVGDGVNDFFVATEGKEKKVFSGKLGAVRKSSWSGKEYRPADFTSLVEPGRYIVVVPGVGKSHPFEIGQRIHDPLLKAAIKSFYYQRFSFALDEKYAGRWHRPFSHADTMVLIHPSAADARRQAGDRIRSPKGWMDAGDYNKYIVNSGITMGTLFSAYEDFPGYYNNVALDIPESSNSLPDLLDEVLWNLRWMLTMQDPADGGVYHKCTNAEFDGMVMPDKATRPRYVVQKSTAATLDFAAVTAQAARVFRQFDRILPGLADSCLRASVAAWAWASSNPGVVYDQPQINKAFDPDVQTGAYGDREFSDERIWAAAELAVTTGDAKYLSGVNLFPDESMPVPSWNQVRLLGYYTLLRFSGKLNGIDYETLGKKLVTLGDELVARRDQTPFNTVMGALVRDFVWGSNAVASNQSVVLLNVYRLTRDKKYLTAALSNMDYILGRNATGYCFVTGFGKRSPMHIHHRPSEADGIAEPVPGFLAGGPNPGMQDKCKYASTFADEAFTDDVCSYASNEIAINWNAPLVYLAGGLEAILAGDSGR